MYWEERNRKRISRRESNSGHRERSCAIYRSNNHEDIGAYGELSFNDKPLQSDLLRVTRLLINDICFT